MLAILSSPLVFITAAADASSVPPTQKPSVFAWSAPVISSATSIAFIAPFRR